MPIRVAASTSWAVARMMRPARVHFMKATSAAVNSTATRNATTWERLKAASPMRMTTPECHGRTKRKSPVQATRAAFWSAVDSPTVVKIWTLWLALTTPRITSA